MYESFLPSLSPFHPLEQRPQLGLCKEYPQPCQIVVGWAELLPSHASVSPAVYHVIAVGADGGHPGRAQQIAVLGDSVLHARGAAMQGIFHLLPHGSSLRAVQQHERHALVRIHVRKVPLHSPIVGQRDVALTGDPCERAVIATVSVAERPHELVEVGAEVVTVRTPLLCRVCET